MQLYELVGANDLRFSPYCWRTRFALAHKGFDPDIVPCHFTEKDKIAFSGQTKVPVLVDGERSVHDSWDIACYLEGQYPDRPSLFGGDSGRALARFINNWADTQLNATLAGAVAHDVYENLAAVDRDYFRETREKRLGKPLEVLREEAPQYRKMAGAVLTPLRMTLSAQPFLAGDAPAYADYIVMGSLQWVRQVSEVDILNEDDALYAWRERMLDLFEGMARTGGAKAT